MRLNQRHELNHPTEGPKASREDQGAWEVFDECGLPHEEVPEHHTHIGPLVERFLVGQLDPQAD